MSDIPNKYKPVPFWSWNDALEEDELVRQINWMHENGIGGFFMHARGGLTTPYLGEKWFSCVEACLKRAKELDMEAYAYDENGWPSGFVGGLLLEDELNRDMYVTYKYGPYDPTSVIAYDYKGDKLIKTQNGEDVLNIYLNVSTSTADILNKEVVQKFITLTHKEYKKHDIYGNLRGFFTDEPQYYRWGTSYTRVLPQYFQEKYGEDVIENLGLLFLDKEGYEDYRYKYFKSMQELMLDSFAKQIYDYCTENNYKLTGHYIEEKGIGKQILCCGGIMPFYEYEHIPGVDHLGRDIEDTISGRQLGSVIAQLDKEHGLCEMFACTGWDATPLELKKIAEYYLVNGINLICHHLLPYSEHGQRKRDYPEHYSAINPWVEKSFKDFNDHFSRISELVSTSSEIVEIGVFHPLRSAYFKYNREAEWGRDFGASSINDPFIEFSNKLTHNGVMYHYLDETIMAKHAHVEGDTLVVGKCRYKYICISENTLTMDKSTYELFKEYSKNGGKFHVVKDVPTYLEGKPFTHDYFTNLVSFEDLLATKPYSSSYSKDIKLTHRVDCNGREFIYAVNIGGECDIEIKLDGYKSFEANGEILGNHIHFNEGESKILYFSNEEVPTNEVKTKLKLGKTYKVEGTPLNYLTLDFLKYSKDGLNYSNKLHYMAIFNELLVSRYQGELYLKYEFDVKDIPTECEVLLEDTNTLEVTINSKVVDKVGTVLEKDLWKYDIAKHLKEGKNEIVIKMNFVESEAVYYALFGENVQESFKNCLAYDTTIEAIYLRGNFGVDGEFKPAQTPNVVIGDNFSITKQKDVVTCLVEDGYPFFRVSISLSQYVEIDDVNKILEIDYRFQVIDLYVNNQFVKRMLFENKVDLSKYLKVGTNNIRLELVVSNRNLLGPHHFIEEESFNVGPWVFERFGTWREDGTSDYLLPRYTFVKPIY